jgi:hypothetical protein
LDRLIVPLLQARDRHEASAQAEASQRASWVAVVEVMMRSTLCYQIGADAAYQTENKGAANATAFMASSLLSRISC